MSEEEVKLVEEIYKMKCSYNHHFTYKTKIPYKFLNVRCPHCGSGLHQTAEKEEADKPSTQLSLKERDAISTSYDVVVEESNRQKVS